MEQEQKQSRYASYIFLHQLKMNLKWRTTFVNPESLSMLGPLSSIYISQDIYILTLVGWEEVYTQPKKNLL